MTDKCDNKYRILCNDWESEIETWMRFPRETPVLILGETGTGKELVARNLHFARYECWGDEDASKNPFLSLNCALIDPGRMEDQLFGHKKGSFTGAVEDRPGAFQKAGAGTLFLDEIQELTPSAQGGLLRAIQERQILRLGAFDSEPVNCSIILASNKDILTDDSAFRKDLYYRINDFEIALTPLRHRDVDALVMAKSFIKEFSLEAQRPIKYMTGDLLFFLLTWHWPGNIRELRTILRYLCYTSRDCLQSASLICKELQTLRAFASTGDPYDYRGRVYNSSQGTRTYQSLFSILSVIEEEFPKELGKLVPFDYDIVKRYRRFKGESRDMNFIVGRVTADPYKKFRISKLPSFGHNELPNPFSYIDKPEMLEYDQKIEKKAEIYGGWMKRIRLARNLVRKAREVIRERDKGTTDHVELSESAKTLKEATKEFRRKYVTEAIKRNGGNKTEAAKDLGVSKGTIYTALRNK